MRIINRYITGEIFRYAAIVLTVVVGIYVVVDFFERIDNFLGAGLSGYRTIIYLGYKIPFIIAQILPVSVLLSVLITFGLMRKSNEITALKSGGISIYALLRPVLVIGLLFTAFLFLFTEIVVPAASGQANHIWLQEVKKKSAVVSKEKNIWFKDNRIMNYIRYYNKAEQAVYGITLYFFDPEFRLARRVDAKKGLFHDGQWTLMNIMEQTLTEPDGEYDIRFYDRKTEPLGFSPENLETVVQKSEEMSFRELLAYVHKVEEEGYDATHYRVDLHAKIAFPFICAILSVMGLGIALKGRFREGLPVAIAFGICLAFLYWIFYSFCISLGYGGMLPPPVAAWTANVVFSCFAALNLLNAE